MALDIDQVAPAVSGLSSPHGTIVASLFAGVAIGWRRHGGRREHRAAVKTAYLMNTAAAVNATVRIPAATAQIRTIRSPSMVVSL
jgi:hypothetical protein